MKKFAIHLLALWVLLSVNGVYAAWDASWTQRAKITLNTAADGLQTTAVVDAVPVVVRLHTGNFQFLDAKPDGSDLRFIAADDKTPLKHHIEKYDAINELAIVWVQVPKVSPGVKADFIWAYYGNPGAAAANDPKGTFDANQGLVYHFTDGEATPQDATANANHALRSSAKPSSAGLIGGGLAFGGSSELVVAVTPSLKASAGGLTVSMWIKPAALDDAVLWGQQEGNARLSLQLRGGRLVAQSGALSATSAGPLASGTWQHVALVVKDGLAIHLNGQEVARAVGSVAAIGGQAVIGSGLKAEIDELQVSSVARGTDWLRIAAGSQGPDQRFVVTTPAEAGGEEESASYMKILLSAVTLDGWIVIGILGVMFVLSLWVMWVKVQYVHLVSRDNRRFMQKFEQLINGIDPNAPQQDSGTSPAAGAAGVGTGGKKAKPRTAAGDQGPSPYPHSQLYRLYSAGIAELQSRFDAYRATGRPLSITPQSLNAIRATVEAGLVREIQRLNSQMVVLTISIAGGPFLGLLGTVVGVMITFAAIAAAGDVNVNAIAPGIAAALVATVAGLAVAIPALFAYNYLTGRIGELTSDMQVFVDELTTRIAENHSA